MFFLRPRRHTIVYGKKHAIIFVPVIHEQSLTDSGGGIDLRIGRLSLLFLTEIDATLEVGQKRLSRHGKHLMIAVATDLSGRLCWPCGAKHPYGVFGPNVPK